MLLPSPTVRTRLFVSCTALSLTTLLAGWPLLAAPAPQADGTPAAQTNLPDTSTWFFPNGDLDLPKVFATLTPDQRAYLAHITTLANPYFEGRAPGTKGIEAAAGYLEFWHRYFGLTPAFPAEQSDANVLGDTTSWSSYRQHFDIDGPTVADTVSFSYPGADGNAVNLSAPADFAAMGIGTGTITAPLAFIGYAIEKGPSGFETYASVGDVDLTGRIAVILRFEPSTLDGKSKWTQGADGWSNSANLIEKFQLAKAHNAAGVVFITPPDVQDRRAKDLLSINETNFFDFGIPGVHLTADQGDRLLKAAGGHSLAEFKAMADADDAKPVMLPENSKVTLGVTLKKTRIATDNVGSYIPGKGALADQWIIIGAHYDHVGYGGSGSMSGQSGTIHPGADDNGSGTSAVLLLAQRMKKIYDEMPADASARSVLFLHFSAEELGLIGSRYYANHPTVPLDKVSIMLNMDMVGRLHDNALEVGGVATGENLEALLKPHFDASGMNISPSSVGDDRSDHASFRQKNVPALFFFTGLHNEYHRPTDVASLINTTGAVRVADLVQTIALDFAQRPEAVKYVQPAADASQQQAARPRARVRLGIVPSDYNSDDKGVRISGASEGTAAAEAGLVKDDVIIGWNDVPITNMQTLTEQLVKQEPGDVVNLKVVRGNETIVIPVKLKARSNDG